MHLYIAAQSYGQLNDCDVAFILNATIRNRVTDDVVVEIKLSDIERAILKHLRVSARFYTFFIE